jgi:hypothetical protein
MLRASSLHSADAYSVVADCRRDLERRHRLHPRTAALNRKQQWREWSGYFASSVYADFHDIEYNAIREAAALIDVSRSTSTGPRRDASSSSIA